MAGVTSFLPVMIFSAWQMMNALFVLLAFAQSIHPQDLAVGIEPGLQLSKNISHPFTTFLNRPTGYKTES